MSGCGKAYTVVACLRI